MLSATPCPAPRRTRIETGRGDLQLSADRIDPVLRLVSFDVFHGLCGRGSSFLAKRAEADFRISLDRRSSLTSRPYRSPLATQLRSRDARLGFDEADNGACERGLVDDEMRLVTTAEDRSAARSPLDRPTTRVVLRQSAAGAIRAPSRPID